MTQADPQSHPTVLILGNSPAICAIRDKILHLASFDSIGFLDEVDALTIQLQAKLLKAIEEKRIRRLGAVSDRSVDVKIVAATQKDLNTLVSRGHFRADLFHRLAVVVLELPPLRARGEDILLLANHYLSDFAEAHRQAPRQLTENAKLWLLNYSWPGNVRELSHLMERATLLQSQEWIDPPLLEQLCTPGQKLFDPAAEAKSVTAPPDEAGEIRKALTTTGGNVLRAARILGLSRNALRYRIRRYGIKRPVLEGGATLLVDPAKPNAEPVAEAQTVLHADASETARDHFPRPNSVPTLAEKNQTSFIGRTKELSFLQLALQSAVQGRGRMVFISGQAGIGKTRLVRELRRTSQSQAMLWLEGCFNRAGNHPYQAWVQVLRKFVVAIGGENRAVRDIFNRTFPK